MTPAGEPAPPPMLTVLEVIKKTSAFFASRAVESPRLDAELLVGHVLKLARMRLYLEFERPVSDAELGAIRELVRRRARREPLQHILGFADFCGIRLKVDRRALIPRPETELLVETVTARCAAPPSRILDLGTGGGAIALALARAFPEARVTAADASADALALAAENAQAAGLAARITLVESDWYAGLPPGQTYGLIVSNPPYLSAEETAAAAPEVREHEPARALTAADGGFADLARIVEGAPRALEAGGMLALETGIGHRERLAQAAERAGLARGEALADLTGRDRFFLAWR